MDFSFSSICRYSAVAAAVWFTIIAAPGCGPRLRPPKPAGPQATPQATEPDLKILSHNTYLIPGGGISDGLAVGAAPGRTARANAIANASYIKGFDVVVLNELFDNGPSNILLKILSKEYPYQTPVVGRSARVTTDCKSNDCWTASSGGATALKPEDGGVAIVSKWPIEERVEYIFKNGCGADNLSAKGFAYVRIRKKGTPYHIMGTHVQADDSMCKEQPSKYRLSQFSEIRNWIQKKRISSSEMLVIAGDLNVDSKEKGPKTGTQEYKTMLQMLNVAEPVYLGHRSAEGYPSTWDSNVNELAAYSNHEKPKGKRETAHLDYIFFSKAHRRPAKWANLVMNACMKPSNWREQTTLTYHYGHDYSDHFPVAASTNLSDLNRIWNRRNRECFKLVEGGGLPGETCTAGWHGQCAGKSQCLLGARSLARCSEVVSSKTYWPRQFAGCSVAAHCPPGTYCPVGNGPCKAAMSPGSTCLAGQHHWCAGESKCILGTRAAKCSQVVGGKHYQALGFSGCGPATHCPPGTYCPVGNGPCRKAMGRGSTCNLLIGSHQCKGNLTCKLKPLKFKAVCE